MRERTLQGALTFLGFALSVIAIFYFAIEYIPRVSAWTQVASLILLGLAFAFLGVYLRATSIGQPFFSGPRLQWLRPPVVLYLLAIFSGIVAEIRFLSIDGVPKPAKILASLAIGVGLIVVVAQRAGRRQADAGRDTRDKTDDDAPTGAWESQALVAPPPNPKVPSPRATRAPAKRAPASKAKPPKKAARR